MPSCEGMSSQSRRRPLRQLKGLIRGRSTITRAISSRMARLRWPEVDSRARPPDRFDRAEPQAGNMGRSSDSQGGGFMSRVAAKVKGYRSARTLDQVRDHAHRPLFAAADAREGGLQHCADVWVGAGLSPGPANRPCYAPG